VCLLVLGIASWTPALRAQTTSTIEGAVKDKQGAAIGGARVRLLSTELAMNRSTTTEVDGTYRLAALPPGTYEIRAEKDGFQSEVFNGLEVTLNRTLTFDITLQVGAIAQTIEVKSPFLSWTLRFHPRELRSSRSKFRICRSTRRPEADIAWSI
jgi:hypothetical protein